MDRYDGLLRSVARSFRLQDADVQDVAQTTWLRLLQHLHTIRDPEALPGWLAVTESRESLSILRKASRLDLNPMFEEPRNSESAFEPESAVVADDTARDLSASVGELPPAAATAHRAVPGGVGLVQRGRDELCDADRQHRPHPRTSPVQPPGPTRRTQPRTRQPPNLAGPRSPCRWPPPPRPSRHPDRPVPAAPMAEQGVPRSPWPHPAPDTPAPCGSSPATSTPHGACRSRSDAATITRQPAVGCSAAR
jgi:hypothetical protein